MAGEAVLRLPPLATPAAADAHLSPDQIQTFDAVALFADRAMATSPSFRIDAGNAAVVARICRRLDGLPLAIELAAARTRVLSAAQIDQRLDERYRLLTTSDRGAPARQQSLRAVVDWSHDLCSPEERLVWARASAFSGGFDRAAAEFVCGGAGVAAASVPGLVAGLVDKSIVVLDEGPRLRLTNSMREYGAERLAATDEEDRVRARHRDWFATLVRDFTEASVGPDQVAWAIRLRAEHANLRSALDYCLTTPDEAESGLELVCGLDDDWGTRGLYAEMRRWLGRLLTVARDPTPARAHGLRLNGWYALLQGDLAAAASLLGEAGELAEALGLPSQTAYVTTAWAMGALFGGEPEQAVVGFEQALERFREVGEVRGELFCLVGLGLAFGDVGDPERALAMLDTCVAECTRRGEVFWRAYALWGICEIEVRRDGLPGRRPSRCIARWTTGSA